MTNQIKFHMPREVETIPGTEGWERMYPDYYQFVTDDPERQKHEEEALWFFNGLNFPEAMYPFDMIWPECCHLGLSQYNTRFFSIPTAYGLDQRVLNGYIYFSPVPIEDPEVIQARVPDFMARAGHYYANWKEMEGKWEVKMKALIDELDELKIEPLQGLEDMDVITGGIGESRGYKLLRTYDNLIDLGVRCWQYHFEHLNLGYAAYVTFMDFCKKVFPDIPLQRVSQMVGGIDVIMYRPDEELKKLAKSAVSLQITEKLLACKTFDQVPVALRGDKQGERWLAQFEEARYPWFYISTGTGMYHHHKSWNDDLNVPFNGIVSYIQALLKGGAIDRPTGKIKSERDAIIAEYRSLIGDDKTRATFDQLLNTVWLVFPYVENHLFYVEHWFHSVFWNKVREVAKIMKEFGVIEDTEDIWYLKRGEIKEHLWDIVTAWATVVRPRGCKTVPAEVKWRKGVLQKFREWSPPPALGTLPEKIHEPFSIVLWGVTNDALESWSKLQNSDETVSAFSGYAASPGLVEGPARICLDSDEIGKLQEGEILVAPTTSPSWAPAFNKIVACVTDVGGVMCHAAIVCREYGVPAVVGTGHGTKVITTGQMLRVNGATGEIQILQ